MAEGESKSTDFTSLHRALATTCDFVGACGFDYAVAGGLAVAVWGEPRATFDVDVVAAVPIADEGPLLSAIRGEPAFVLDRQTWIAPPDMKIVRAHYLNAGTDPTSLILIDFLLLPELLLQSVLSRRVELSLSGRRTFVVSCEDLILLKLLSGRVKDLEDIRGIRRVQGKLVDNKFLGEWIDRLGCQENWQMVLSKA